jgi:hypothetical protein
MLIKLEEGQPVGNPILENNFRQLYPSEVFPLVLTNEIVNPFGYGMYDFSQVPEIQWDESVTEGPPQEDAFGIWRQVWVVSKVSTEELQTRFNNLKNQTLLSVDRDVDLVYSSTVGNRAVEYQLAEQEALDYKNAEFTGPVPVTVQDWATVKSWTPQQAAEDVLASSAAWRSAQLSLRKQRLTAKDQIRQSSTLASLELSVGQWRQYLTQIRQSLGLPPPVFPT